MSTSHLSVNQDNVTVQVEQEDHPLTDNQTATSTATDMHLPPPATNKRLFKGMTREQSDFLEFSEPAPIRTTSGRWGMIVVNHVGTDGIRKRAMVKPQGAPAPEMRKFSSFEM